MTIRTFAPLAVPVYVTRPVLPLFSDYTAKIETIWRSGILTNSGPMHQDLERAIQRRIGFGRVSLWSSGTAALIGTLQSLDLHDEVIVTPFTFPATVHAIAALGFRPVFADVKPDTMTIDPERIADRITSHTSGVVGTHIYGTNCDTAGISAVVADRAIRVVYDGAHSFARARPIFPDTPHSLGDATMLSFHATKLFHTVEGGAVLTRDAEIDRRLRLARNFGIRSENENEGVGLNGKLSELHSAMGLLVLEELESEFARRAEIAELYRERLESLEGIRIAAGLGESKQYFVIRVTKEFGATRDEVHEELRSLNIHSRRYFHPVVSDLAPFNELESARHLPNARLAANECLVLPFHGLLDAVIVEMICDVIASMSGKRA